MGDRCLMMQLPKKWNGPWFCYFAPLYPIMVMKNELRMKNKLFKMNTILISTRWFTPNTPTTFQITNVDATNIHFEFPIDTRPVNLFAATFFFQRFYVEFQLISMFTRATKTCTLHIAHTSNAIFKFFTWTAMLDWPDQLKQYTTVLFFYGIGYGVCVCVFVYIFYTNCHIFQSKW